MPTLAAIIRSRRDRSRPLVVAVLAGLLAALTVATPGPAAASAGDDPVIIVAGTVSPAFANEPLRARLTADGYDAYIYELPGLGVGDIAATTAPLASYVDAVLAATGADRVDLIGHSQGGLVARYFVKELGGAAVVDSLISLGAPHYGTALANLGNALGVDGICDA